MPHQWSMTANTHGEPMTTPPNWRGHGGTQYNLSLTPVGYLLYSTTRVLHTSIISRRPERALLWPSPPA